MIRDFHHFKGGGFSRSEKIQRKVAEMLLQSKIPDEQRESSIVWELKHSAGCCQIGRVLAQKRNLDIELAEVACILHDIYVIAAGKYEDHAKRGADIARQMLEESGDFSVEEVKLISEAVAHHSEKQVYSDSPYVELVKDADVFDCSLYENAKGFYMLHKPKDVYEEYVKRIKSVRKELELQEEKPFRESNE